MKALNFSRLMFVLGLTLGVMVLLAGTSPTVLNANSLIGGTFWPAAPCGPCSGTSSGVCEDAASGPPPAEEGSLGCTTTAGVTYCLGDPEGEGTCQLDENIPCENPGDPEACNTTHDMPCEGLE